MAKGKYTRTAAHIEKLKHAAFIRNGSMTPAQRFWTKVQKGDGCWEWKGQRNRRGYGEVSINSKWRKAHRFAWEITNGEIPEGMHVCHRCDNPACVRPEHLFLGTARANTVDSVTKGRHRSDRPKLTAQQVREMRALAATQSIVSIAEAFGVDYATAHMAIRRKSWREVE